MIYWNNKKYPSLIDDRSVQKMERNFHMKCLYGGFVGSNVYGTANKFSDYDFAFVFFDNEFQRSIIKYKDENSIEWNGFNIQDSKCRIEICKEKVKKFPSFYTTYRCTPTEDIMPDFLIFTSDYIWDSGYLYKNYKKIITDYDVKLILDYYFNRAAGNLEKNLCKDKVSVKRIIQTILGINCMLWILEKHTLPYLSFSDMTKLYHKEAEQRLIFKILQDYQRDDVSKENLLIPYNKQLNRYISTCLQYIESEIIKMVNNDFLLELDKNSFLARTFQ